MRLWVLGFPAISSVLIACGHTDRYLGGSAAGAPTDGIGDSGAGGQGVGVGGAVGSGGAASGGLSDGGASTAVCGNGMLDGAERCDDGNAVSGDGCSSICKVEQGWDCTQSEPSICAAICGDGLVVGAEAESGGCDDKNKQANDGCGTNCQVEAGYVCSGEPSVCAKTCGDGKLDAGEACDDGNPKAGDGCFACAIENGYTCDNSHPPSACADVDECAKGTSNCSPKATCTNTPGSFSCACKAGYAGNGLTCGPASCNGLAANCGPFANDDCCAAPTVTGGTFKLGGSSGTTTATIATFALDKYEVSVGRFRNFVKAYTVPPADGAGAHPLIAGSGWQSAWNSNVPDQATLIANIACDPTYKTWNASGMNDRLPMNCVDWYEAFAFCLWDGGRLPTEAEWEYAAAGGPNDWVYPWGNTPVPTDVVDSTATYANYHCLADNGACAPSDILPVGSKPAGAGKYGQMDLAGSMWEWALDWYAATYPTTSANQCTNCANLTPASNRVLRGAGWDNHASLLPAAYRHDGAPTVHIYSSGLRCARTP